MFRTLRLNYFIFEVRKCRESQFQIVQSWLNKDGWNTGTNDFKAFQKIDPQGFWVGVLNDQIIGSVAVLKYNENFGAGGYFYLLPEHRSKNYGYQMYIKSAQRLRSQNIKNIWLQALQKRVPKYEKWNFKKTHDTKRFILKGTGIKHNSSFLKNVDQIDIVKLAKYDEEVLTANRLQFLKLWTTLSGRKSVIYEQNQQIKGYGVIKPCYKGYAISPLFADSVEIASEILKSLIGFVKQGTEIYIDMPSFNQFSQKLQQEFQMKQIELYAGMTMHQRVIIPFNRYYALTSRSFI